jgi:DNA repair ATPase RecN
MNLTTEQQQALALLTGAFEKTASQKEFNEYFEDELEDLKEAKDEMESVREQILDTIKYISKTSDIDDSGLLDLVEQLASLKRDYMSYHKRINAVIGLLEHLNIKLK